MNFKNMKTRKNRPNIKTLRSLLLSLVAVIPMACTAGPLAEKEVREVADFHKIEVGGLVNASI